MKNDFYNELVRPITQGDQKAFERLFRAFYKPLCQFAFLFLHSKELSEEAVSDVLFNVWMKREQLAPVRNIRAYLYTAVRHQAIDYLRTNPEYVGEDINVYELEIESSEPTADEMMEREESHELLQKAFNTLPERCRMIARMFYNDQLQYKEIADILGVTRKTVEAQIAIAIHKVADFFDKQHLKK